MPCDMLRSATQTGLKSIAQRQKNSEVKSRLQAMILSCVPSAYAQPRASTGAIHSGELFAGRLTNRDTGYASISSSA